MAPKGKTSKGRSAIADVVAREYTIHLHKRVREPAQEKGRAHGGDSPGWAFQPRRPPAAAYPPRTPVRHALV